MRQSVLGALLLVITVTPGALAQEKLCDTSVDNCRIPLVSLIRNERIGIDVGVWFFKDTRIVDELIKARQRGVPIRMLMDVRANLTYPANGPLLAKLKAAGIPMRRRTAGDILHWKLMIFAGQGEVEWSGANFSPMAFMAGAPYQDYEDEVIYYSHELIGSFMTVFDNIWTNTRDYANYANINEPLARVYPTFPIDPRLNFPPTQSYQSRLVPLIDREPAHGWIDVDMYRVNMARPVDALIRAAARGVRERLYFDPKEYANKLRPGNKVQIDRLVAAAARYPGTIEIRMRAHKGLNHQKTVWLHTQHIVVFGTSNWSSASDDNQLEANIFTDNDPGTDALNDFLFDELQRMFERKWYNDAPNGAIETTPWRTPVLPPPVPLPRMPLP
jgi:phosphatidylserine/phosphatidylglycerophosphate/cardiolipin synthase-like enzyme